MSHSGETKRVGFELGDMQLHPIRYLLLVLEHPKANVHRKDFISVSSIEIHANTGIFMMSSQKQLLCKNIEVRLSQCVLSIHKTAPPRIFNIPFLTPCS